MLNVRRALTISSLLLLPDLALAALHVCEDPMLSVQADTEGVGKLACNAATSAKALLSSCGLVQDRPINIAVVDIAQHPTFGDCLATFDQQTECLAVTDLDRMSSLLPVGDPRSALPPDVLFAAAITHEMAHALLQQSARERQIAATEQEFVANAFEMESLEPQWRNLLLDAYPINPPGSLSLVHLTIYALEPRAYANNAWLVFDQDVMGCSLVQKIAAGEFRFPRH
ncbi:hypothetical protein [Tabrizicola sp.]|uniref:hypothetical protein n=1 Tax=Tabrizicola sp. TaxID=2005166 RepID=UPI00262163D8|nr:hypothetical protein [Tabrizicola sp.]MDM7930873.1 hypothetical protein [Tabrizicola sp.]